MTHTILKGTIYRQRDGSGILVDETQAQEISVLQQDMHVLMHKDQVTAKVVLEKNQLKAHILEITKRASTRFLGQLNFERNTWLIEPEDKKVSNAMLVDAESVEKHGAKVGNMVIANILRFADAFGDGFAEIEQCLGEMDNPGIEISMAVQKYHLPHEFSEATEKELKKIPNTPYKKDYKGRVDLTDVNFTTIDGADARDFDDAVYCEPLEEGGWRLLVAIADVAHYVKDDTALNFDALQRATSVYFPRKVIPMLPEKLSNGLCSLNPMVDRLCMVCDMVIDPSGNIEAYQFYEAVMHSKARLTYEQVWQFLAYNQQQVDGVFSSLEHVQDELHHLYDVFHALFKARSQRGAIDFDTQETKIMCDELGKVEKIVPYKRNKAHQLIEECMLSANVCAAHFLEAHQAQGLYRIHDQPSVDRIGVLKEYLVTLGLKQAISVQPSAKELSELMKKLAERQDFHIIQQVVLRSMQQAVYSPQNIGHFGLNYRFYAHFTSPIRRYPDLLVHRAIKGILKQTPYVANIPTELMLEKPLPNAHGKKPNPWQACSEKAKDNPELQKWLKLGQHCSMAERRADEASRDVESWLKAYFIGQRLGEVFTGKISTIASFGIFILLDDLYIEGLIHISALGGDYFIYNEKRQEIVGQRTGKIYKIGTPLTIQVSKVDVVARKIDFVLFDAKSDEADEDVEKTDKKRRRNKKTKYKQEEEVIDQLVQEAVNQQNLELLDTIDELAEVVDEAQTGATLEDSGALYKKKRRRKRKKPTSVNETKAP